MRVEFVGLPAAGKTSACRAAHADLRRLGVSARLDCVEHWRADRRRLLADYARGTTLPGRRVTAPWCGSWLLRRAVGQSGSDVRRGWGACAYVIAVDAHVRRLGHAAVWLHDQATVQALWSVSMRTGVGATAVAEAFGARLAWPDAVLEVRAPLDVVARRLADRPRLPASLAQDDPVPGPARPADDPGPATSADQQNVRARLRVGQQQLDGLRAAAAARGVAWVRLDDAADAARAVADLLGGRARQGGGQGGGPTAARTRAGRRAPGSPQPPGR